MTGLLGSGVRGMPTDVSQSRLPQAYLHETADAKIDPGCGVDIPAAFYSLSFAPKPEFSRFFPKQEEILRYIEDVAQKFNVTERFVGNTEWEGASWQDDVHSWSVRLRDTSTGRRFTRQCKVLVSAVGGLTNPNNFNMPGIDTFTGDIVHTARWDPNVSLAEKNVIVVGNGCVFLYSYPHVLSANPVSSISNSTGPGNCRGSQAYYTIHPG